MKASENSLIKFLQQTDTQFVIPVYQRNYDWTESQCKKLFEDILAIGDNDFLKSHFIGSIVYIADDIYTSSEPNYFTIIDGQQRLTTIILIWIGLLRIAKENNNEKLVEEIEKKYLYNQFLDDKEKIKLRPVKKDDLALKHLLNNSNTSFNEYSRLINNYEYFISKITNDNFDIIRKGISKLTFVEIVLQREKDDPQKIFESLNSTGLDLSQADLIRNYILMSLKPDDQKEIYENYWVDIEKLTLNKNTNQNRLSDFVRDFLTLKFRDIPNKSKIFEVFKTKFKYTNVNDLKSNLLDEIKKFSFHYNILINPENQENIDIKTNIELINKIEITVAYPFLLEVYNDYSKNVITSEILLQILKLIQSYVWRRFILNLPTNSLNKVFMRLYEDIDKDNYLQSLEIALLKKTASQRFPNDNEIREELFRKDIYNSNPKNRYYFLERLENFNNNEPVKIEDNDYITIEHIMPKVLTEDWKKELGKDCLEIHNKYLNTISNLTLSGNNGSLGNKPFKEKRDLKDKGYKDSKLFLNKYLSKLEHWTEFDMKERFNIIFERFKLIWEFPKVKDLKLNTEEELNIFDIESPTNNKIEYVIFSDEKILGISFKKLLTKIATFTFETEPERFFTTELGEKLKLTRNENSVSSPIKIGSNYFIEGHGNAIQLINKIKKILQTYDLEDELFIKFKNH